MKLHNLHGKKLLHVDDDQDYCQLTKTNIKTKIHSVIYYQTINGKHTLHLLKRFDFDCVICDYTLPDMTGLNLMLNSREMGIHIPFVFLSSREERSIIHTTMRYGAKAFHNKWQISQKFDELLNSLNSALDTRSESQHRYIDCGDDDTLPNFNINTR
jgi:DNA-binding NtrC family response regulator